MKQFLCLLMLASLALAGCSGGKGGGDGTTTTGPAPTSGGTTTGPVPTTSGGSTTTGPAPTTGGENHPPTATLSASTEGGALPLLVNFTLDADDLDGDDLDWTFDADGDGDAEEEGTDADLPAQISFTYDAAGIYNATLNVTDDNAFAEQRVSLEVTEVGGGPGQAAALAWLAGPQDLGAVIELLNCEPGPFDGVFVDSFEVDSATIGLPFQADVTDASDGAAIGGWHIRFNLADCSAFSGSFDAEGAAQITGTVPEGSLFVYLWSTGGAMLEVTYQSGSQIGAGA